MRARSRGAAQARHHSLALTSLALLALSPLLIHARALAGTQVWTGTAPRAKSVEAIARDPLNPARLWAATFGAGVYRSLDGGATWTGYRTGLVNTFVRALAVEPQHPDSVFCGTNDGVFLSTDGGVTWATSLSTLNSVRALAIHPVKTGTIYAGTNGSGVFKSLDAGRHWSQINLGLVNTSVRDVVLHPANPETVYVATGTGGGVHRSYAGGLPWSQVPDTTATHGAAEQIQFDRLDPSRIYVAELDRGVLKSADGGNSWSRINRGLTTFRMRSLALADTLRYVGSDGSGVFVTTLNDSTWHPASAGLTNGVADALLGSAATPRAALAGTDGGGIYSTTSFGASWAQLDGGLLATFGFSLAVRPSTHVVYAGLGFGDQSWRSADHGVSWTRAMELFSHDSEHGIVPDPVLAGRVYASAYGSGVYRSDDDGATWFDPDSLNGTLGNHFVRDLVAWPGQSGHLFVATGIGPFETLDGGAHWSSRVGNLPASFSVRSLALVPGAPATLYAGSDSAGIFKSADGGSSWSARTSGLTSLFVHGVLVDAANSAVIYAGTDSGAFKSTNGGGAWVPARNGLPAGDVTALAQDAAHPGALFAGIYGQGVFESRDGAASWQPVFGQSGLASHGVRSLAVDGALWTLYAGTDDGVAAVSGYALPSTGVAPLSDPGPSLSAWPNPARGGRIQIRFTAGRPGRVRVAVYDLAGHRVRTLSSGVQGAGEQARTWDGADARGRSVASGVYFVRLETPDGVRVTRVTLLRDEH